MMSNPTLLMLDEPSQGLAPLVIIEVFRRIRELNRMGVTILLIEQNVHHALKIAGDVFVLDTGAIVMQGKGAELKNNEHIRKAYLGL
jgi:branched-chain amino acid transport system ATP-binding protein